MQFKSLEEISSGNPRNQQKDSLGEVSKIFVSKKNLVSLLLIVAKVVISLVKRNKTN